MSVVIWWDLVLETVLFVRLLWQWLWGVRASGARPLRLNRELRAFTQLKTMRPIELNGLQLRNRVS